jgi:hypothetical protein
MDIVPEEAPVETTTRVSNSLTALPRMPEKGSTTVTFTNRSPKAAGLKSSPGAGVVVTVSAVKV